MEQATLSTFGKGVEAFEDLERLADQRLIPVINRARFHFSELKRISEDNNGVLETFSAVEQFLEKGVSQLIQVAFQEKFDVAQFVFEKNTKKLNLARWNKVLDCLPAFLKVASFFSFENHVHLNLDHEGLRLKGPILQSQDIKKARVEIYAHFRRLLKLKTFLTFNISEDPCTKHPQIELFLDLGHDSDKEFVIQFANKNLPSFGLSNIVSNYVLADNTDLRSLGKHFCLEISEKFEIIKHQEIPEQIIKEQERFQIMHFHFLFRPISMIIPGRGKLFPTRGIHHVGDTGSDQAFEALQQDVHSFQSIDLFSLFGD